MSESAFVLDNSVLSAFSGSGWFESIAFWSDTHELVTSARVWENEYVPHHDRAEAPDWLSIEEANLNELVIERSVRLGDADYSLIRLTEDRSDCTLVTNDKRVLTKAEENDLDNMWGSKFLKETFEQCGISRERYQAGLSSYFEDVPISSEVRQVLRDAEKL
ncbi:hypothetical protein [Halorubrum trapanicum]|uniref:hypothetical protein n=1 Tax=Halorubrum trapanicum TaxID=29284 RepID=UPI0012FDB5E6|nr:hypothetical protein [Halorubrum trapanicum]